MFINPCHDCVGLGWQPCSQTHSGELLAGRELRCVANTTWMQPPANTPPGPLAPPGPLGPKRGGPDVGLPRLFPRVLTPLVI